VGTDQAIVGYFVCPYGTNETLQNSYCCGPPTLQTCCKFWEK